MSDFKVSQPTINSANHRLGTVGMKIGEWGQLAPISVNHANDSNWINYQAPRDGIELFNFSQYITGWLPSGEWKILQLDYSCALDPAEESLFGGLLQSSMGEIVCLDEKRTFLFEFGDSQKANQDGELLIANLIFTLLMFEGHAHLVSSGGAPETYLSLQDGFVYFFSDENGIATTKGFLNDFQENPLRSPKWVNEICIARQSG